MRQSCYEKRYHFREWISMWQSTWHLLEECREVLIKIKIAADGASHSSSSREKRRRLRVDSSDSETAFGCCGESALRGGSRCERKYSSGINLLAFENRIVATILNFIPLVIIRIQHKSICAIMSLWVKPKLDMFI